MKYKIGDKIIYRPIEGQYIPCMIVKELPKSNRYRIVYTFWTTQEESITTDSSLSITKNEGIDRDINDLKKQIDHLNSKIGELKSKKDIYI